jgi:hypothetical protein
MVALLDSGDTAAWTCGRGVWTLPSMPFRTLTLPRTPRGAFSFLATDGRPFAGRARGLRRRRLGLFACGLAARAVG